MSSFGELLFLLFGREVALEIVRAINREFATMIGGLSIHEARRLEDEWGTE